MLIKLSVSHFCFSLGAHFSFFLTIDQLSPCSEKAQVAKAMDFASLSLKWLQIDYANFLGPISKNPRKGTHLPIFGTEVCTFSYLLQIFKLILPICLEVFCCSLMFENEILKSDNFRQLVMSFLSFFSGRHGSRSSTGSRDSPTNEKLGNSGYMGGIGWLTGLTLWYRVRKTIVY